MAKIIGFNYEAIDNADVRVLAQNHAQEIHSILERTTSGIIEIGRRLIQVHAALGRDYSRWVDAEFRWTQSQASNFEQAAEKFGHLTCIDQFQPTALFLLMRKSVEPPAIREAIKLAERGQIVTRKTASKIISKHAKPGAASHVPDPVHRLRSLVHRYMRELPTEQRQQIAEALAALVDELQDSVRSTSGAEPGERPVSRRRPAALTA